jgi:hypothetical protein
VKKFKINEINFENLSNQLKTSPDGIIIEFLPESDFPRFSDFIAKLHQLIDKAIVANVEIKVENVPFCFMVAYKRYVSTENGSQLKKMKTDACKICKYFDKCDGIFEIYIEKYGDGEIVPISSKILITDNEKCMIEVLLRENNINTKRIMELKSVDELKEICAHCVGDDDVFITGNKLMKKDVVKRNFSDEGYIWELNTNHPLIVKYTSLKQVTKV